MIGPQVLIGCGCCAASSQQVWSKTHGPAPAALLVAVAGTRITRAAEQLHIAQPPLSRQIRLLEEIGVTLLLRNTRPLRLTDAGRVFHEQALQILGGSSR